MTYRDKIPAAFIITGRNIASQDLLFEQLADTLRATTHGRFVRIRSAEAPNLKSVLKKIIKDATARTTGDEDDAEVSVGADVRLPAFTGIGPRLEERQLTNRFLDPGTEISRL